MKISSTSGKGNFILEKENNQILEVKYKNWFSSIAYSEFDGNTIEIKPKNIWCSKFDIFKNNQDKGDLIFNWKGDMIIRITRDENKEDSYLLVSKGLWKRRFELTNEKGDLIFILQPFINWKKLSYNYEIESILNESEDKSVTELLIYCGFAANLYMTTSDLDR